MKNIFVVRNYAIFCIALINLIFINDSKQQISLPENPCPDIFKYQQDGNNTFGVLELPTPENKMEIILKVRITAKGNAMGQFGRVSLFGSNDEVLRQLRNRTPLKYLIHFPAGLSVPKVVDVVYDEKLLCSGTEETAEENSFVSLVLLRHRLEVPANLTYSNEDQLKSVQTVPLSTSGDPEDEPINVNALMQPSTASPPEISDDDDVPIKVYEPIPPSTTSPPQVTAGNEPISDYTRPPSSLRPETSDDDDDVPIKVYEPKPPPPEIPVQNVPINVIENKPITLLSQITDDDDDAPISVYDPNAPTTPQNLGPSIVNNNNLTRPQAVPVAINQPAQAINKPPAQSPNVPSITRNSDSGPIKPLNTVQPAQLADILYPLELKLRVYNRPAAQQTRQDGTVIPSIEILLEAPNPESYSTGCQTTAPRGAESSKLACNFKLN